MRQERRPQEPRGSGKNHLRDIVGQRGSNRTVLSLLTLDEVCDCERDHGDLQQRVPRWLAGLRGLQGTHRQGRPLPNCQALLTHVHSDLLVILIRHHYLHMMGLILESFRFFSLESQPCVYFFAISNGLYQSNARKSLNFLPRSINLHLLYCNDGEGSSFKKNPRIFSVES